MKNSLFVLCINLWVKIISLSLACLYVVPVSGKVWNFLSVSRPSEWSKMALSECPRRYLVQACTPWRVRSNDPTLHQHYQPRSQMYWQEPNSICWQHWPVPGDTRTIKADAQALCGTPAGPHRLELLLGHHMLQWRDTGVRQLYTVFQMAADDGRD